MIANNSFNEITLRKALIIENMMNKNFNFSTLNITDHLKDIRLNDSLKKVLRTTKFTTKDFRNIKEKAIELLTKMQSDLTTDEKECLRIFFDEYRFDVQLLEDKNLFHPNIQHHPSILRTLQELKEKHNTFYTREGIRYELCRLANLCF